MGCFSRQHNDPSVSKVYIHVAYDRNLEKAARRALSENININTHIARQFKGPEQSELRFA